MLSVIIQSTTVVSRRAAMAAPEVGRTTSSLIQPDDDGDGGGGAVVDEDSARQTTNHATQKAATRRRQSLTSTFVAEDDVWQCPMATRWNAATRWRSLVAVVINDVSGDVSRLLLQSATDNNHGQQNEAGKASSALT